MCNLTHHFRGKLTIPLLVLLAIVLMVVLVAPPSYADPNFTWDRAAYWDERYPSAWAGGGEVMRDALEYAGYEILDANKLKAWMDAHISNGMPSVVVFCHDIAPDTVVESMSSRCTLRRYLDAGGKIVWYADIPMIYQGHSDGTRTDWGYNSSIIILGFDAASGPGDTQDEVAFTADGRNWGLTETWQSKRPTSHSGLRVLAKDASGYAAAWVKHYVSGDSYRGFVRLFDQIGVPNFNDVRRVAEYPNVPEPIVYYVDDDATGANDGSSWADAYWCLQDALAAGRYGDEIRVAQGNYKPDQQVVITARGPQIRGSGDRTETFQLISGVAIKGGYAGFSEPYPDARDIEAYKTILSGDLNGDDMTVANPSDLLDESTRAENSFHVVTGSGTNATAMLDGFTITAGNANGPTVAEKHGGGMYNQGGSPTLIRCIFHSNNSTPAYSRTADGGGAIYNAGGSPALTQCTFTKNNSARDGGGMFNINSRPTVTHCTFSGNSADSRGGGMFNESSSPTLTNCILWVDTPEEIYVSGGTPVITYSDVQGGWPGAGNIDADPLFVDAANGDYHLQASSPCIDAGDNSAIPAGVIVDLDGNPRIINGIVDMGAYEGGMAPTANVYYVDAVSGDNSNDGLSFETAFATIQKGIDMAGDGDVVLVYPGLYQEEINFLGKAFTVQGVAAGPAGVPVLQNPGDFAVSFYSGEGTDSILKNFIIRDSFMGIFITGSAPTISNLTVVDNKYGIEAYAGSEPDISNTIFWNNTDGDLFGCRASYSCMERGGEGEGNINADPLFVDPDSGDYHLRSERGRYWPEYDVWVLDEITSPCVDGGDPTADYSGEPMPNGGRINMGAYGGTPEASLSPAPPPPPPKGRGCFPGDTPVWVNGALVQISNVVSGQMVGEPHCDLATDCFEQIETVEEHEGTFECRDIVLESGNRISVVDAHCFMLDSGQWIAAQELRSGLRLKTLSGTVGIKSVATRAAPFVGKVYNLKVTGVDRYLVSEDGVIVRDY